MQSYNKLVSLRRKNNMPVCSYEEFRTLCEMEDLTVEELRDIEYLDDRMDVWFDNEMVVAITSTLPILTV